MNDAEEFRRLTADMPRFWVYVQKQANDEPRMLPRGYRDEERAIARARRWFAENANNDESNPTIVQVFDTQRGFVFSMKGWE